MTDAGTVIKVWDTNGDYWTIADTKRNVVELENGVYGQQTLLTLETPVGTQLQLIASIVVGWVVSSRESRGQEVKNSKLFEEEHEELREEAGYPSSALENLGL